MPTIGSCFSVHMYLINNTGLDQISAKSLAYWARSTTPCILNKVLLE